MAKGRDEEFAARAKARALAGDGGVVDLGKLVQGPPDPRDFPATFHETTFRKTWHKFERILTPEGEVVLYRLILIDAQDRHIYNYGLDRANAEAMVKDLQDMLSDPVAPIPIRSDDDEEAKPEVLQ